MGMHFDDPWFKAVTAEDLCLHGLSVLDGETPVQALMREAESMDVDLAAVGRCLQLLANEPCILAGGSPMGMLAASPRLGMFRTSFDGDPAGDLTDLSPVSAGVWLTMLAAEAGELPQGDAKDGGHWLLARLAPRLSAVNPLVLELAEGYARMAVGGGTTANLDSCGIALGAAFWRCAAYRLR